VHNLALRVSLWTGMLLLPQLMGDWEVTGPVCTTWLGLVVHLASARVAGWLQACGAVLWFGAMSP
jgi:hypothetical protein